MSYLELLELKEEPFSNSPDPEFFYESPQHLECLHRLEISIRLMRGLNVVLGEVGAGKSTLARLLLRNLNRDEKVQSYLMLDPHFSSSKAMLQVLYSMLLGEDPNAALTEWQLKEAVKGQLFKFAVDDDKLLVLIIDEGQKITHSCLEVLRELLNYETNNTKLLQIVIFAQTEFSEMIRKYPNVADRINEYTTLGPLTFRQTRDMIRHRVSKAGQSKKHKEMFTMLGYLAVHRLSGGYPRKVIRLCHKVMLGCILGSSKKAGWRMVHACAKDVASISHKPRFRLAYGAAAASFLLAALVAVGANMGGAPHNGPAEAGSEGVSSSPKSAPAQKQQPSGQPSEEQNGPTGLAMKAPQVRKPVVFPESSLAKHGKEASPVAPAGKDSATLTAKQSEPKAPAPLAPAASAKQEARAQSLGPLTVTSEISVDALLQLVYGESNVVLKKRFMELNPKIDQSISLPVGAEVILPDSRQKDVAGLGGFVVQITQDDSLQMAVEAVQGLKEQGMDVAIAAQRSGEASPVFSIVHARAYPSERAAVKALRQLPPIFQPGAKVVRDMHKKGEVTLANLRQETASVKTPGQDGAR